MDAHGHPDTEVLAHARRVAERAARAGGAVALRHFRDAGLRVETKDDGSFVSAADRAAEAAVREALAADPDLGGLDVLGEEAGVSGTGTDLRWVVDPIDGTFLFVNGIPLWGTLVALEDVARGVSLAGVVHLPAIGACYTAARGLGAARDGVPILVRGDADPLRTVVHVPDARAFERRGMGAALAALRVAFPRTRGYFDCFGHALAADGAIGAAVDLGLAPWDLAASTVLVEEAGGVVLTRPSTAPDRTDAILGAPAVVEQVAALLAF